MKSLRIMMLAAVLVLTGCIARGSKLNYNTVNSIQRGVTTEQQIRAMFGEPVATETRHKLGIKVLQYGYSNDDSIKKDAATVGGAALGGALGNQIGGGSGQAIASGLGAALGGLLGENAVTARQENQSLTVIIDLRTGVVKDFDFSESKGRTQSWSVNSGVGAL